MYFMRSALVFKTFCTFSQLCFSNKSKLNSGTSLNNRNRAIAQTWILLNTHKWNSSRELKHVQASKFPFWVSEPRPVLEITLSHWFSLLMPWECINFSPFLWSLSSSLTCSFNYHLQRHLVFLLPPSIAYSLMYILLCTCVILAFKTLWWLYMLLE